MASHKTKNRWKTLGGLGVALAMFGGKLKFLLPLLKLGKLGGTIWSMLLMVGAYGLIYPWSFSIGIVVMIFIHEMGHIWAAKRKGLPVSAPAFIPFLGALITMKKQPVDAETEAYIAYGGPLVGSIGALIALILAIYTGYEVLYVIAQIGFFLNLLNLMPIHPLDGGRIVTAISRWLWIVGLVGGFFVILYLKAFIFLIIWLLFAWQLYNWYIQKRKPIPSKEESITLSMDRQTFEETGIMLPGENHSRTLPFLLHCPIQERSQVCSVWYPGIGHLGDIPMEKGHVEKVELIGTQMDKDKIHFQLKIRHILYPEFQGGAIREEEYYQVSGTTRLKYGMAYFALAGALVWLMIITGRIITGPFLVG